ncbi:MAG: nucleotidyltransferase domain-containing protein [Bdellovibrio sp.]
MKFGLKDSDFDFLEKNLILPLKDRGFKVYIFGSRATGKNHPFSDVDILIEGEISAESSSKIGAIKEFFEESNFPYKIDLVNERHLAESYRPGVMRERIEI